MTFLPQLRTKPSESHLLRRTTVHLRIVLHQVDVLLLTRNQQSSFMIQLMAHKYLPQGREMMMLVAHLCLMLFLFLKCQALNKQGLRRYLTNFLKFQTQQTLSWCKFI